jgi:hypothetical protein
VVANLGVYFPMHPQQHTHLLHVVTSLCSVALAFIGAGVALAQLCPWLGHPRCHPCPIATGNASGGRQLAPELLKTACLPNGRCGVHLRFLIVQMRRDIAIGLIMEGKAPTEPPLQAHSLQSGTHLIRQLIRPDLVSLKVPSQNADSVTCR